MPPTLLLLHPIAPQALTQLRDEYRVLTLYDANDPGGLIAKNKSDIRAVIAGEKSRLKASFINSLDNLEMICLPHRSLHNIDPAIQNRDSVHIIPVNIDPAIDYAEHALALVFGISRRVTEINMMYRTHHWRPSTRRPGRRINGKRFALFGDDRIKAQLSSTLTALGASILENDSFGDLRDITYNTDHLILLPGLEKDQFGIVNREVIENFTENDFIVAIAADDVIRIQDIAVAIHNRRLGGFAMDTLKASEDMPEQLLSKENVLMTPGISASTLEAAEEFGQAIVKIMNDHFNQ